MIRHRISLLAIAAAIFVTVAAVRTAAGPPTICVPLRTESYPVLPEKTSTSEIVGITLRTLDSELPVLARMETLRRAVLALQGNMTEGRRLMMQLMARTLDGETNGRHRAVAWFDAGYFARCCEEAGALGREFDRLGSKDGVAGYAWIEHALRIDDGGRASMHFAAALMTATTRDDRCMTHLRLAGEADADEPLVTTNAERLREHVLRIRGWVTR